VSNLDTTVGLRGTGTLSVNAGSILLSNTVLGAHDCSAAGVVSVTGGSFTNATLDIRSGTFTMSAGTVGIGELVITNACGRLIRTGGTLSAGTTNLAPNLSAAGDGLPNGWKQSFGLDPFNPSLANQDPDGDGRPNGFEFENGTDPTVAQSTNSWTSATGGKWEDGTRWLLGAPSIAHALILITNANTKTVTADATTGTNTLRIFALKIAGPNTLRLDNAGTLTMVNHLRIETGGTLSISNSSARVDGVLSGAALNMEGAFDAANGALTATSLPLTVNGPFSMTGGTLTVAGLNVATQAGMTGAVTLANTAVTPGDIFVAPTAGARGELRILGAPAPVTPQYVFIGWNSFASAGNADLLLSNATLQVDQQLFVGGRNSRSTATLRDATVEIGGVFRVGNEFASTGEVWMVGGQLRTPSLLIGGEAATGRLSVSNGIVRTSGIDIGFEENAEATLTVAGGTVSADFGVTIGHCSLSTSNCVLAVTGGSLFVTNATGDAELVLERGTLLLSAGTIVADRIVMNSACVNFVRTGGTLIYGTAVLNPADDTDGDGLSNGYEQANGLDPLDPTDAAADTDGDGFTNLQEYLAGTDPLDSASALRITAITREADDIRVTWMTAAGKTNALERTAGVAGSFTNNFTVLTNIVTTGTSTNVLDVGAATNVPAFYYRVRLVP
jgi:hypothetical protein